MKENKEYAIRKVKCKNNWVMYNRLHAEDTQVEMRALHMMC